MERTGGQVWQMTSVVKVTVLDSSQPLIKFPFPTAHRNGMSQMLSSCFWRLTLP